MFTLNQTLLRQHFLQKKFDDLSYYFRRILPLLFVGFIGFSNSTLAQLNTASTSCGCGSSTPSCEFTGPAKACPSSSNTYTVKKSIPSAYTYNWSISGKGKIVGSSSKKSVTVKADNCCDGKYKIKLTIKKKGKKISECSKEVWVGDKEKPTVTAGWIEKCYKTKYAAEAAAVAATKAWDNCTSYKDLKIKVSTDGNCSACITVTVTDKCGNSCSVKYYTKIDNTPPKVTAGWIEKCYKTQADAEAAAIAATTAYDNCGGYIYKYASTYGDCYACITVTVYDECGNSCAVKYYTRIDGTPPTVPTTTIGSCYKSIEDAKAAVWGAVSSAYDNCTPKDKLIITISCNGYECDVTFTVTVTDECGNTTTVYYYTRIDNTPPTVKAGTIGDCYKTQADAEAAAKDATTATDNCPGDLIKTASTYGDCYACITVTVTDKCGNSCSVKYYTRIDNTAPVFQNCPDKLLVDYTCDDYCFHPCDIYAKDNCDGDDITYKYKIKEIYENCDPCDGDDKDDDCYDGKWANDYKFECFKLYRIIILAIDKCGNVSKCKFKLLVLKGNCPTIAGRPSNSAKPLDAKNSAVDKLSVVAYPMPYQHELNFKFVSPVSGKAVLEVYNTLGQKMGEAFNGNVTAGSSHTVTYKVPVSQRVTLMYRLSVGNLYFTGSAIPNK